MIPAFRPHPWQVAPFLDKHEILLLSGKPGGGKSTLAGNKVHGYLLNYPGAMAVVTRKTLEDMDQSTIPFMLHEIIHIEEEPRCSYHVRSNTITYDHGDGKKSYLYFKGMFGPSQQNAWKSIGVKGDVDLIWGEEATEFEESDIDTMLTRLRGTAAPWQQIILTTNPGPTLHWINVRIILGGEGAYYYSDWTMNPAIDQSAYTRRMNKIKGLMRARMWDGAWTDGEGLVIDQWQNHYNPLSSPDPQVGNVLLEADYIPDGGPVVWTVDEGYSGHRDAKTGYFTAKSNPRAFLLCQKRPNGRLLVFHGDYEVQMLQEPHIKRVMRTCDENGWPRPAYALYDSASPTLGKYLEQHGIKAVGFKMGIKEGIDELQTWVAADENGVRRLIVHPRVKELRMEFGAYVYGKDGKPIDAYNHGIDAIRYLTNYISFGEPKQAQVEAPGVDMEQIRETVRVAFDDAMEQAYARLGNVPGFTGVNRRKWPNQQ